MKLKKRNFDSKSNYVTNLIDCILAISEIRFVNNVVFLMSSATKNLIEGDERSNQLDKVLFDTDMFDDQNPKNIVFIAQILPIEHRQDVDGIFVNFLNHNEASFVDVDHGNYTEYFTKHNIVHNGKMKWQQAYDKLCELAKAEQELIPVLSK